MKSKKILFLVVLVFLSCSKNPVQQNVQPVDQYPYPAGKVFFTSPPVKLDSIVFYEGLGQHGVRPKSHGGFHHPELLNLNTTIPVFAVGDGQITILGNTPHNRPDLSSSLIDDYWIALKVSTTMICKYGHVGRLSESVLQQAGTITPSAENHVSIPVKSGDVIGFVSPISALDFGFIDMDLKLNYCYPSLLPGEDRFAGYLFNYLHEPLKTRILDMTLREVEPRGGKVDYDEKGTLSGIWYLQGSDPGDLRGQLTIAYDHLYGARIRITDGLAVIDQHTGRGGQSLWTFWIKGNAPRPESINRNNGKVKLECIQPGSWRRPTLREIDLEDISNIDSQPVVVTYLIELTGPEELKLEKFDGMSANEVSDFTNNLRTYVRNPL